MFFAPKDRRGGGPIERKLASDGERKKTRFCEENLWERALLEMRQPVRIWEFVPVQLFLCERVPTPEHCSWKHSDCFILTQHCTKRAHGAGEGVSQALNLSGIMSGRRFCYGKRFSTVFVSFFPMCVSSFFKKKCNSFSLMS